MSQAILSLRSVCCIHARGLCRSLPVRVLRYNPFFARFSVFTLPRQRFYSSEIDKNNEINFIRDQNEDSDLEDDVSTEVLQKKIDQFYKGDIEALPSIFEAILKRKLSGKHEEADDKLMKEIRRKMQGDAFDDDELHSDSTELEDETDHEMDSSDNDLIS